MRNFVAGTTGYEYVKRQNERVLKKVTFTRFENSGQISKKNGDYQKNS